jgi:hypothetical protein
MYALTVKVSDKSVTLIEQISVGAGRGLRAMSHRKPPLSRMGYTCACQC